MFTVQYRCLYRDYWYDDIGPVDWNQAVSRVVQLHLAGRRSRIVDEYGNVHWTT